jgi:hypothetical protein
VREARYEIRVRGPVSRALLERLEGMTGELGPVETILRGRVRDQAELHGLLDRVRALDLELVEVRRLPSGGRPEARASSPPAP